MDTKKCSLTFTEYGMKRQSKNRKEKTRTWKTGQKMCMGRKVNLLKAALLKGQYVDKFPARESQLFLELFFSVI